MVLLAIAGMNGCGGDDGGGNSAADAKAITAFSFVAPAATGTITGNAIAVAVPYGTDVTALVATYTTTGASVKVGGTVQTSGTTPNNFTNPVACVVTAADSSTATYTVTVTVGLASSYHLPDSDQKKCYQGVPPYAEISCPGTGRIRSIR